MKNALFPVIAMLFVAGASIASVGCVTDTGGEERSSVGTATLPLTAVGTSGTPYRLRTATFRVFGSVNRTFSSEDHLTDTSVRLELPEGDYVIRLDAGWSLERTDTMPPQAVNAALTTSNSLPFHITDQGTTVVSFRFRVGDDAVDLGNGTLIVDVGVDDVQSENTAALCNDGLDNDRDMFIDCQDFDCAMFCGGAGENTAAACSDMQDNDGDGFFDCQDFDCAMFCGGAGENTAAACSDMQDNDGDGFFDCQDFDCAMFCGGAGENTAAACSDMQDNDGDGFFDCQDFDCAMFCGGASENTAAACSDMQDNDGDGFFDCQDFDCAMFCGGAGENTTAACGDMQDNDGDGFFDCQDFDCVPFCATGESTEATCSDTLDNDGDGFIDCQDFSCSGLAGCM